MKYILFFFFLLNFVYSQPTVQIGMGASYQYDIFYSFEDGITAFPERENWELAFSVNDIPNINCAKPGGAFYVFPDFSYYLGHRGDGKILKDTFDISEYSLKSAQVFTVTGDGFG